MEKILSNCDFGCVHAKIAKVFALIAVVLAQLTMPAALSVFLNFFNHLALADSLSKVYNVSSHGVPFYMDLVFFYIHRENSMFFQYLIGSGTQLPDEP